MNMNKGKKGRAIGALTVLASILIPQHLLAGTEKRCGWFDNPTPANHFFSDADGDWILTQQGGYRAKGYDALPAPSHDFSDQWVTSGSTSYGHGCACIVGAFDHDSGLVIQVESMQPLPLEQCRADHRLPSRQ